ncbi:hypothetical protein G9A89_017402 [Geosiphon pyriformis]|nr:hypothetical protein G9A89_017402 [Geosiphon pyriformis]
MSKIENSGEMTSYFAADVFVDNTIWVKNYQAATQYALNITIKDHFEITSNIKTDFAAVVAAQSFFSLLANMQKHFLVVNNTAVSGSAYHFVRNIFWSICHAHWEAGLGCSVVPNMLIKCVNWISTVKVWHPNFYMLARFTSWKFSSLCTYLMKAIHKHLPVVIRKKLYNKDYSGMLCLLYSKVKFLDHAFTYV